MKMTPPITILTLIVLSVSPCLSQISKHVQGKIDSLKSRKLEVLSLIEMYNDTVKQIDIQIGKLIKNHIVDSTVAENKTKINRLIGPKGVTVFVIHSDTLFENPDKNHNQIVMIEFAEKVLVLALENYPYYKVKYKKIIGYINGESLKFSDEIHEKNNTLQLFIFGNPRPLILTKDQIESVGSPNSFTPNIQSAKKGLTTTNQIRATNTECSSVQCSGMTQKGNRCKNRTTSCNGRCYLH